MTFVHIADVHVGMSFKTASFAGKIGQIRRTEIKETLFKVLDYCEAHKVTYLLIAGDLFEEEYITVGDLKDMNHRFGRLSLTKVLIGAGNHDPIMNDRAYYNLIKWSENVFVFKDKPESYIDESQNVVIHSFSWDKKHLPSLDLSTLPVPKEAYTNILMLHGDAYGTSDYLSFKPDELMHLGYDYIALGHIHKQDFVRPNMAYPGSLEPLDFSEVGPHGMIVGQIENHQISARFEPFCKRTFHVTAYECDASMSFEAIKEALVSKIGSYATDDMIRLTLRGYLDKDVVLDIPYLETLLRDQVFYVEIVNETEPDLDLIALKRDYEGSLIGVYIHYIEALEEEAEIKKEALYKGLKIMLREQVMG